MDDPWGSPWAAEGQSEHSIVKGKENNETSTTPTPARASGIILQPTDNSPWGDDNDDNEGFGEWSTEYAEVEGGLDFDPPIVQWDRNVESHGMDNGVGHVSPHTWADHNASYTSSAREPNVMPEIALRQPSPDPWTTQTSRNEEPTESQYDEGHVLQPGGNADTHSSVMEDTSELHRGNQANDSDWRMETASTSSPPDHTKQWEANELDVEKSSAEQDRSSSRPSSSPSEDSQHGDKLGESPRTSMEDDPQRPQTLRRESLKVQGRVEHFDGQGHAGEEIQDHSQDRGKDTLDNNSEDFGEFGDFDDDVSEPVEDSKPSGLSEKPVTINDSASKVVRPSTPPNAHLRPGHSSPLRTPKKFFGPIEADVDLSILDDLFPNSDLPETSEKIFIPDIVPFESFTSLEQRKMWYRVSRYGSMRKHNSGDDENYIRVAWQKSTVRDDTLKIVARWMEEDRLSGQVILGGSGRTSTLFGWGDSKAPPLPLSTPFGATKTKAGAAKLDTSSNHTGPSQVSPKSPHHQGRMSIPAPVVANFGWNRTPESATIHERPIKLPGAVPADVSFHNKFKYPESSTEPTSTTAKVRTTQSQQANSTNSALRHVEASKVENIPKLQQSSSTVEDEDDWGDMVSSPALNGAPPLQSFEKITAVRKDQQEANTTSQFESTGVFAPESLTNSQDNGQMVVLKQTPTNSDPWVSADFSFFDPSHVAPNTKSLSKAPNATSTTAATPPPVQNAAIKAVSFRPLPVASKINKSDVGSREEAEQESIVQSIIDNLPDLSYMLRR